MTRRLRRLLLAEHGVIWEGLEYPIGQESLGLLVSRGNRVALSFVFVVDLEGGLEVAGQDFPRAPCEIGGV